MYPVFPVDGDQLVLFVDFTHFFFQRDCREYGILVLFCNVCKKAYKNVVKKSLIGQHVGSKTHEKNHQLKQKRNVTDAMAHYVANVLIGVLDNKKYHAPYLANVVFLEKTNSVTILSPSQQHPQVSVAQFDADLLKLLLSDAAEYILNQARNWRSSIPHSFTSFVWPMISIVSVNLSANVSRGQWSRLHREEDLCKSLLPHHYLERDLSWSSSSTWACADKMGHLDRCSFVLCQKFRESQTVVSQLSPEDAAAIGKCQKLLKNHRLTSDLAFIAGNLAFLPAGDSSWRSGFAFGKSLCHPRRSQV